MEITKTDDLTEQIKLGKRIVQNHPNIYKQSVVDSIYETIRKLGKAAGLSDDDIFYISVYDYWQYGFTTEEVFYLGLLSKTEAEKQTYISHMDRINYMHYLNKTEDEYLLTNKYETYKMLEEYYGRTVICIDSESDYAEFQQFFNNHDEFIIKPIGMATSIGVRKVSRKEYGCNAEVAFKEIISEIKRVKSRYSWAVGSGVIIEEIIKQGEPLSRLHPASINSIRLTTIRKDDKVYIFCPVLRIGMGGEFLCCGAVGSILTGINISTGISETDG